MELLEATVAMATAACLGYLLAPAPEECSRINGTEVCIKKQKPLSPEAWFAIGAGTGLVVGGIMLQFVPPYRWRVVIRR